MSDAEGDKPQTADERVSLQRRTFMRAVSRDAIHGAAVLMGASDAIRSIALRAVMAASPPAASEVAPAVANVEPRTARPTMSLSAYRRDAEGRLLVTDRTLLPDSIGEVPCVDGSSLARLLSRHVVGSGPVLGELTAYALAGTAAAASSMDHASRTNVLRATSAIMASTRPASGALKDAVRRSTALWTSDDGSSLAESLLGLADTLSADLAGAVVSMAGHVATLAGPALATDAGVLFHGAFASLATGSNGAGTQIVRSIRALGPTPGIWVTEGRPSREGLTATSRDLAAAGIRSTVVADAMIGSLLASGRVGAAMVFAEHVADDGTVTAPIGTYPLAVMAALHRVPFLVLAPMVAVGGSPPTGVSRVAPQGTERPDAHVTQLLDMPPLMEQVPPELVTAVITEDGPG